MNKFITPEQVRSNPNEYSDILSKILLTCYGEDYPGVSIEQQSNIQGIVNHYQQTCFWAITEEDWEGKELGTSSMIKAKEEFGEGFAEMGKSGSIGSNGSKNGYREFINLWESNPEYLTQFDSLVTTVRNCPERLGKEHVVKSGTGIRVIFLKYLHFQQWGIAPWYLMPDESDGSYEVLDLLFKYREEEEVKKFIQENELYIASEGGKEILDQFMKFNLNISPKYAESENENNADLGLKKNWKILSSSHKTDKNPVKMVCDPSQGGEGDSFPDKFQELTSIEGAMHSIYLPLDEDTRALQQFLEEKGWILTGFVPSKICFKGMWSKLNRTDRPMIRPAYLDAPDELSPDWYKQFVSSTINKLSNPQLS